MLDTPLVSVGSPPRLVKDDDARWPSSHVGEDAFVTGLVPELVYLSVAEVSSMVHGCAFVFTEIVKAELEQPLEEGSVIICGAYES